LFASILYQALEDADYTGIDKKYLRYKQEAIEWLIRQSNDFCLICEMAGYDPIFIIDKVKSQMMYGKYQFTQSQYDMLFDANQTERNILKFTHDK
tara:strand:+ start:361 stop:645 length:285 start_codon:yes stop_codon:yes gene_type:complete